jgi:hypothetical protein
MYEFILLLIFSILLHFKFASDLPNEDNKRRGQTSERGSFPYHAVHQKVDYFGLNLGEIILRRNRLLYFAQECPNAGTTVNKACQDTKTNVKGCDFYV